MLDTYNIPEANRVISMFKSESFSETLEQTLDRLGRRWEETEPEKNRYEYAEYILEIEKSDKFDYALSELTYKFQLCRYDQFEELVSVALDLAFICAIISKKEYEQGNADEAFALINKASYYQGALNALDAVKAEFAPRTSIRNSAKKGGETKSKRNFGPCHEEAARLLIARKPENGWTTYAEAIRAISKDVLEESKKTNSPLTEKGIIKTLRSWMKENSIVQDAFESSRRQKENVN